jgi:hypothetical protein
LRSGTFFGVHGGIARELQLYVAADGLPRAAIPGETVWAPAGSIVNATVSLAVPETDWEGQPNRVERVELILVTPAEVTHREYEISGTGRQTISDNLTVGEGGLVIRARVRAVRPDAEKLMAYTNAVRITTE